MKRTLNDLANLLHRPVESASITGVFDAPWLNDRSVSIAGERWLTGRLINLQL